MSNNKYIKMLATTTGNYTLLPVILATVSYQLHVRSCYQLRVTGHSILPAACNKLLPAMFDRSHYFTTALHVTGHSILPAMCIAWWFLMAWPRLQPYKVILRSHLGSFSTSSSLVTSSILSGKEGQSVEMITNTKTKPSPSLHHVLSTQKPELSKVLPLQPTLGQTIALPAFLTAGNSGFIPSGFIKSLFFSSSPPSCANIKQCVI